MYRLEEDGREMAEKKLVTCLWPGMMNGASLLLVREL